MEQKKTLTELYEECKQKQKIFAEIPAKAYATNYENVHYTIPPATVKEIKKASDTPAIIGLSLFLMVFFGFCIYAL